MLELKFLSKKLLLLVLCGVLVCSIQACAACTAVYVGSDVSDEGSIIVAR